MTNKSYFFILFLLAISTNLSAQPSQKKNFSLDWQTPQTILLNNGKDIKLPLVKNNTINENLLPTFYDYWKNESGLSIDSFYIDNVVSSFENTTLPDEVKAKIGQTLTPHFTVVNSANSNEFQLYLEPFFIKNNRLYKVESFTLNYTLTSKIQNKSALAQNTNSILASGSWYKFAVDTTGVFKLDLGFLKSLGINTSNLNANNIRIFGNGGAMLPQKNSDFRYDDLQENALFVNDGGDNLFNNNDYMLFYAKGPDSWEVNPVNGNVNHQKNSYSNQSFYFISTDSGLGKRLETTNP
ncbi:MAG: hypothetical protein GW912_04185, partial [Zetaproteobacteria bacterium]|nr:hypothetical protein [Flavobacteriales bacterium]